MWKYSKVPDAVTSWKAELYGKGRAKIAKSIAHPETEEELFEEGWDDVIAREDVIRQQSSKALLF